MYGDKEQRREEGNLRGGAGASSSKVALPCVAVRVMGASLAWYESSDALREALAEPAFSCGSSISPAARLIGVPPPTSLDRALSLFFADSGVGGLLEALRSCKLCVLWALSGGLSIAWLLLLRALGGISSPPNITPRPERALPTLAGALRTLGGDPRAEPPKTGCVAPGLNDCPVSPSPPPWLRLLLTLCGAGDPRAEPPKAGCVAPGLNDCPVSPSPPPAEPCTEPDRPDPRRDCVGV
eukprot:1061390-Rhodomonas_salina.2